MGDRVIKVAITGLGVSRSYIPNYVKAPESELVIVHDTDAARAQEVAQTFGVPKWTTHYADVLTGDADMVDISTPNHVHAQQTIDALQAGKHVLCQKPMARNVSECKQMIDTARRTGKTLGLMMTRLDNEYGHDIRRAIAEGYLGKIAGVRFRNSHRGPYLLKDKNHWRASQERVGGGSFIQLGVHQLNLALWLLNQDVVSVMGYSDNLYCKHSMDGEDVTAAVGQLTSGALITMESGYSSIGRDLEIYGTEGRVIIVEGRMFVEMARDFSGQVVKYTRPVPPASPLVDMTGSLSLADARNKDINQNRLFVQALLEGRPAPTPGEIGLRDIAIVQAIYRSAAQCRRVNVREILDEA